MNALILDVETSGLDPDNDHLLEVGMVLWSIEHRTTIDVASYLVRAPDNAAQAINGIPPALVREAKLWREQARGAVSAWAERAIVVLAHNADFDVQWLPPFSIPVVDTAWDVDWPRVCADRKLTALALAHGLAVMEAHRALPDCQLLARLLERVAELGHDVGELLRRAMRPKVEIVSLAPFEKKDVVKAAGFRWSPERKVWWRNMSPDDVAALPFRTRVAAAPFRKRVER